MKRDDTEAGLVRRIEALRVRQERAEAEEAYALVNGGDAVQLAHLQRQASQALWNRRKLQKQLNELRGVTSNG